eukprot:UN05671
MQPIMQRKNRKTKGLTFIEHGGHKNLPNIYLH